MSPQEYYIGIIIIFYSFSLSKMLEGGAELWINRKNIKFYSTHLIWIAIVFGGGFNYIWSFFNEFNRFIDNNIFIFFLFLFPIILWQVLVFLLFQNASNYSSASIFVIEDYFESIRTGVYSLASLFAIVTLIIASAFAHQDENIITIMLRIGMSIVLIIGIYFKSKKFDMRLAWVVLISVIYFYKVAFSPNTTYLRLTISASNSAKSDSLRKNTCILIADEIYKINSNDSVVTTRERFKIGNNVSTKIIVLPPNKLKIVRDSFNITIPTEGEYTLKVDLEE